MTRKTLGSWLSVVCCLLSTALPVWADEPSNASLKADIEVLKAKLAQLETRLTETEGLKGVSGIGEKAGVPGAVTLPSGLSALGMSGFVDASYIYNFSEPEAVVSGTTTRTNRGRVFDVQSNGATIQAAELVLEKPMTDEMPIGFRTDLFFGDDAELIHSTGLGEAPGTGNVADVFDLEQAYVTARVPVGAGLDIKMGKFVTLLGSEVIESPANWNFSRSYLFGYAIPFTHTGVLATYPLGELGSATMGVVNGWDIVDDTNKAKSLIGSIILTPFKALTVAVNGITGAEQSSNSHDRRTVADLVLTWQPIEKLTLMGNYDFGHEGAGAGTGYDSKEWTGLALYAKYELTPKWSLAGRGEWFDDKDNFRTALTSIDGGTPTDINFYEYTLTSEWKLHEHLLARLEYRHDQASEQVFLLHSGFADYQDTVALELITHF